MIFLEIIAFFIHKILIYKSFIASTGTSFIKCKIGLAPIIYCINSWTDCRVKHGNDILFVKLDF